MMKHPALHIALIVLIAAVLTLMGRGCSGNHESELPDVPVEKAPLPAPVDIVGEDDSAVRPEAESVPPPIGGKPHAGAGNPCLKRPPAAEAGPHAGSPPDDIEAAEAVAAARELLAPVEEPIPEQAIEETASRGPMLASTLDDGMPSGDEQPARAEPPAPVAAPLRETPQARTGGTQAAGREGYDRKGSGETAMVTGSAPDRLPTTPGETPVAEAENPCLKESPFPEAVVHEAPRTQAKPATPVATARELLAPVEEPIPEKVIEETASRGPMLIATLDDGTPAGTAEEGATSGAPMPAETPAPERPATPAGEYGATVDERPRQHRPPRAETPEMPAATAAVPSVASLFPEPEEPIPEAEVEETASRGPMLIGTLDDGAPAADTGQPPMGAGAAQTPAVSRAVPPVAAPDVGAGQTRASDVSVFTGGGDCRRRPPRPATGTSAAAISAQPAADVAAGRAESAPSTTGPGEPTVVRPADVSVFEGGGDCRKRPTAVTVTPQAQPPAAAAPGVGTPAEAGGRPEPLQPMVSARTGSTGEAARFSVFTGGGPWRRRPSDDRPEAEAETPPGAGIETPPPVVETPAEEVRSTVSPEAPISREAEPESKPEAPGQGPMLVSTLDDGAPMIERIMRRGATEQARPAIQSNKKLAASMDDGQPSPATPPAPMPDHAEQHAQGIDHQHDEPADTGVGKGDRAKHMAMMKAGAHEDLSHVRLEPPDYPPPERYREGKNLYEANCHMCHGDRGTGTDHAPPLLHPYYDPNKHGDEFFYNAVANGAEQHLWTFGNMPPLPQVSRDQVTAIIGYVRWLQRQVNIY